MFLEITKHLKEMISNFKEKDILIFNNKFINIDKKHFSPIEHTNNSTVAFIDGGQAEILSAGNFCLSVIRIGALVYQNNKKIKDYKKEFYLLTTAKNIDGDLMYQSQIFGDKLIDEKDLLISSTDYSIRRGIERAPINKISNIARRFAELSLSSLVEADFIVLDGTLEPTYKNEEKYLPFSNKVCSLAKSSSLFTASGNSPVVLLNKIGPSSCWNYFVGDNSYFVKLHGNAKHVFRFSGNKDVLPLLVENSQDALFLGYPYGLITVDKFARVSNEDKKSLKMNFLLRAENKEVVNYLNTINAHEILDHLG